MARVRDNPPHPWYDSDIDDAREKMRKLENVWKRTKLEIHRQLYVAAREECTALISTRPMARVRDNPPHPWYDSDIDDAREKMRKLENVWKRTKLEIHRQLYVAAREECTALISARKADCYKTPLRKVKQYNHVSTIEIP